MWPSPSEKFQTALHSFADPAEIFAMGPILPFSVIVKNESRSSLIGIVIRYERTDETGIVRGDNFTMSTMRNDRRSMIHPGEMVFMSPLTGLNIIIRAQSGTVSDTNRLALDVNARVQDYVNQKEVHISLDSAVFEDGSVIGPDKTGNLERMNAWIAADQALSSELLLKRVTRADAKVYLTSITESAQSAAVPPGKAYFDDHLRHRAHGLLGFLESATSDDAFMNIVRSFVGTPIPNLYRRR
jgi:hypothetical protein